MRTLKLLAATALVLPLALPVAAQAQKAPRGGHSMRPGTPPRHSPMRPPHGGKPPVYHGGGNHGGGSYGGGSHGNRWGGKIGGRWYAGSYAPGGWKAYHRVDRGRTLPHYWVAPSFYVTDYQRYQLSAPPQGYFWVRYYDDAVLTNTQGYVYDSVPGVSWDQYDSGAYAGDGYYGDNGYAQDGYADDRAYDDNGYYTDDGHYSDSGYAEPRRDNGVGGALIGAAVGGVAGNVIAGKGNRLAGTLIGAGVGAVAGTVIDRAEDHGRAPGASYPAQGYAGGGYPPPQGGYPPPPQGSYPPPPPPRGPAPGYGPGHGQCDCGPGGYVQQGGYAQGGGYYANGYYYPATTYTTVTVSGGAALTTTTVVEEYYEEEAETVVSSKLHPRASGKRIYRYK